jgi:acyl-CoA synthetase (AMP-forming)/AMP-acid ligase II
MTLAYLKSPLACEPTTLTLADALRRAATEEGDRLYVNLLDSRNQEKRLSFARVLSGAERWAHALVSRGLARGRVALLLPTGEEILAALFGTLMAGGVAVPCPYPLALGDATPYVLGLAPIIDSARPRFMVTGQQYREAAETLLAGREAGVLLPSEIGEAPATPLPQVSPDDVALIQYTSGPLGQPTGVELTHRNIACNVLGLGRALALTRDDVALNWVPLVQDMGLVGGLFTSLFWRCPLHVMPPQAFLMHPHRWLANISRYRVTLSVAPNAAYQLCLRRVRDKHLEGVDLSSWRLALNGAEPVRHATVRAFRERFAAIGFSETTMLPTYGLAENTLGTTCPSLDEPYLTLAHPETGEPVVALGAPLAGQEVAILADGGEVAAERVIGEVVVRGPCVMRGYRGNDVATRLALQDGWLHTGDLGFVTDGQVYLTGRKKDMVIKMGRNYYPADIERVLTATIPGTHIAFSWPNEESGTEDLVVVTDAGPLTADLEKQLRAQISAALLATVGIRADHVVIVSHGTLSGDRRQARELFARRAREGLV